MAVLPIHLYPDPVLRVKCPPVVAFDDELRRLTVDMIETMYAALGVGLAAPQVGVELRLAVVDVTGGKNESELLVLVNPEITHQEGSEIEAEGCLSIPGMTEKVQRPTRALLRAQSLEGEVYELELEGFVVRAVCHEIDHLDGLLFTDRVVGLRRDRVKRELRRLRGQQEAGGRWQQEPVLS